MKTALITACLCAAFHHALPAQSDTSSARHSAFTASTGVSHAARRDATASPSLFTGAGYDATVGYVQARGDHGLLLGVSLGLSQHHVNAVDVASAASERLTETALDARVLRPFTLPRSSGTMELGAMLSVDVANSEHQYADPSRRHADFYMASITLGPAVEWTRPALWGTWRAQLTSPLVGLASHPYSDTRGALEPTKIRVTNLASLRGFTGAIGLIQAVRGRIGVECIYRVRALEYADVQPLRSVSQSLSVVIIARTGGAR